MPEYESNGLKRITELQEATDITDDMVMMVDSLTGGAKRIPANLILKFANDNLMGDEAKVFYPVNIPSGSKLTISTSDGSVFETTNTLIVYFYDDKYNLVDYFSLKNNANSRTVDVIKDLKYLYWNEKPHIPLMVNVGTVAKEYKKYIFPTIGIEEINDKVNNLINETSEINDKINEISMNKDFKSFYITENDLEQGEFTSNFGKKVNSKRIRLQKPIKVYSGTKLTFNVNGLYWLIWEMETDSTRGNNVLTVSGWQNATEYIVQNDSWIMIAFATGSSEASSSEINVSDFEGCEVKADYNNYNSNKLYLSPFVQAAVSATGFNESTKRISTLDVISLPYGEKTIIHIKLHPDYICGFRAGRLPQNLSSNKYWFKNGSVVRFISHEQYFRFVIARYVKGSTTEYEDITLEELSKINPVITFESDSLEDAGIIERNADSLETFINSQNVLSASSHGGITSYPTIIHISDLHGDYQRLKNAINISNYCNADLMVASGDIVGNVPQSGAHWMHDLLNDLNCKPVICTGNHEVDDSTYTDEMVYNYFMKPVADKIGNSNETTYYYTDIPGKNLRIISCDIYQYGATTRSNAHMTSEQLAYICEALSTTPNNYGVILVEHSPCVNVNNLADPNYSTFFQSLRKYGHTHYDINGAPIYDIIDAFNQRTIIDKTYTQSGSPSSISVNADFSSVNSSVEFIAHLTGHIHADSICYLPTETKQLMLNIACANAMNGGSSYPYLADDCDITRIPIGKTQDCINMYVIDRANKKIKITRIGGTKTYDRKVRDYMEIPYKD